MRRIKRGIAILMVLILGAGVYGVPAFAQSDSDAETLTTVDGVVLSETVSPEDAGTAAPAAECDPFFEIDLSNGDVTTPDDSVIPDGFEMICGESYDASGLAESEEEARGEIIEELTEDNEFYTLMDADEETAEVAAVYSTCRLMVLGIGEMTDEIDTFGAIGGTLYRGDYILSYPDEAATAQAYESLCAAYGSDHVMIDLPLRVQDVSGGWAEDCMHFSDAAKQIESSGMDVTVAVLDSGIYRSHREFAGRTIARGYDFVNKDTNPADDNGHGTAVSSIIAHNTGKNVGILPVKVTNAKGYGSLTNTILGVQYAQKMGADVVNISAGIDLIKTYSASKAYRLIMLMDAYLEDFSGTIVAAAGNNGYDINAAYTWPAVSDCVIAVGALRRYGHQVVVDSMNYNYGSRMFVAPAVEITVAGKSAPNAYAVKNGTSFSAPFVSAAAALVVANEPSIYTSSQVEESLYSISVLRRDPYRGGQYCCPDLENLTLHPAGTRSIRRAVVSIAPQTYTGATLKPAPTVTRGAFLLRPGVHYRITGYRQNRNVGAASVTLAGMGRYSGTVTRTFQIVPQGTSITKLHRAKNAVKVRWKKQAKKMPSARITGYQIQVARNAGFSKGRKTITVKGFQKTSRKVTGLKAKKKYYVRVRTYMVVKGKKYCSQWSKVKRIRTK